VIHDKELEVVTGFAPGDIVRLKSGGALMTVNSLELGQVHDNVFVVTVWFRGKCRDKVAVSRFVPETLIKHVPAKMSAP